MPANTDSAVKKSAPRKKADSPVRVATPAPTAMEPKPVPAIKAPEPKPIAQPKPIPVSRPAEAPKAPQKQGLLDFVIEPFSKWFDFIKKNWKQYYLGLLKITFFNLATTLAVLIILGLVLGAMAVVGFGANALTNGAAAAAIGANVVLLVAATAIIIAIALLLMWVNTTISLSALVFTDASFNGKKFGLRATCWAIKWKVLRYLVLSVAIGLVLAIPLIVVGGIYIMGAGAAGLSGAGAGLAAVGGALVFAIAMVYIIVAAILYGFLTQFWRFGFLVEGLGIRVALKKTVSIVRMRLAEVLVFDILWVIGIVIFSIPLFVYGMVESIIEMVVRVVVGLIGNDILILATVIIIMIINTIFQSLLGAVLEAFSLPTLYLFWKKVK